MCIEVKRDTDGSVGSKHPQSSRLRVVLCDAGTLRRWFIRGRWDSTTSQDAEDDDEKAGRIVEHASQANQQHKT